MSVPVSPAAVELMARLLNDLGIRPIRGGSLVFHFDAVGNLAALDEHRHTRYHLASEGLKAHTAGTRSTDN